MKIYTLQFSVFCLRIERRARLSVLVKVSVSVNLCRWVEFA